MDYIITHWQEITSLGIVAFTVILMIRGEIHARKNKKDCSNCALATLKSRQRYEQRKI